MTAGRDRGARLVPPRQPLDQGEEERLGEGARLMDRPAVGKGTRLAPFERPAGQPGLDIDKRAVEPNPGGAVGAEAGARGQLHARGGVQEALEELDPVRSGRGGPEVNADLALGRRHAGEVAPRADRFDRCREGQQRRHGAGDDVVDAGFISLCGLFLGQGSLRSRLHQGRIVGALRCEPGR